MGCPLGATGKPGEERSVASKAEGYQQEAHGKEAYFMSLPSPSRDFVHPFRSSVAAWGGFTCASGCGGFVALAMAAASLASAPVYKEGMSWLSALSSEALGDCTVVQSH